MKKDKFEIREMIDINDAITVFQNYISDKEKLINAYGQLGKKSVPLIVPKGWFK